MSLQIKDKRLRIKDRVAKVFGLWSLVFHPDSRGMSLVEVLMAVAVFTVIITGLFAAVIYGREGGAIAGQRARAALLAKEAIEAVRNIDYNALMPLADDTDATAYGLATTGCANTCWALTPNTAESVDGFSRTIQLATVNANTREVTVVVAWNQNAQRPYTLTQKTRLTNWAWTWQNGLRDPAACCDLSGTNDAVKVKVLGNYAYVVRTATNQLTVVDITNPAAPVQRGSRALANTPTNLAVELACGVPYVYVALAGGNPEIQIFNVTDPNSTAAANGTINPSGNFAANGVDFDGRYVYFGRANSGGLGGTAEVYVFDSGATCANVNAPTQSDTHDYGGTATNINDITYVNNRIYVSTGNTAGELQVINVTTRTNISAPALVNITGTNAGGSINSYMRGADGVVLINTGTTLFVYRAIAMATPTLASSVNTAATITDISKDELRNLVFVSSSTASNQFRVYDINTITSVIQRLNLNMGFTLSGLTYDAAKDKVYAVGGSDAAELLELSPR